jgi:serine/threonine-protein kinase
MEITADICGALDFSHKNGIIHRDIKPANVMITLTGAVKVMDFGIARAVADNAATVTQTANVIGTAQYLSPEQARGETVDARSDVYSTGCLLYELVTGSPPFQGDSPVAVAYQHVRETAPAPSVRNPDVPRALDSIVMKALAKNQLNRYQTAGDMRQDLQRALADQPVVAEAVMTDAERTQFIARTPPPPIGLRRPDYAAPEEEDHRRTGLIWAAVVVALLLVIGVAAYAIVFLGKDDKTTPNRNVPSVVGQLPGAAETALKQAHLTPMQGPATGGPCAENATPIVGHVCTMEPAAGASVKDGTVVTYHLYAQKVVSVPNVQGDQLNDAETALNDAKLGWTIKMVNSTKPENQVTDQDPAAFATVPPGTKVTLKVSTGKIKLPDVKGETYDKAQADLNDASFPNVVPGDPVITTDATKANKVAAESPTPGQTYDPNQKITLRIYQYQAPTSTCVATTPPVTPPPITPPITPPATSPVTTGTPTC